MTARRRGRIVRGTAKGLALISVFGTVIVARVNVEGERGKEQIAVRALSTKPDTVSGGDVLIGVEGNARALEQLSVLLNGADVTSKFKSDGDRFVGLVDGLKDWSEHGRGSRQGKGDRADVVREPSDHRSGFLRSARAAVHLRNRAASSCRSGETLGKPLDANCSIETRVDYYYRSTARRALQAACRRIAAPADVAQTTTLDGTQVPYIVRIETGTINRAIYQMAMLHDPAASRRPILDGPAGWNGRLIYTHGGGCTSGWYRQGDTTGGVDDDVMLRQGYAVASSSLNVFGNNCNDLLAVRDDDDGEGALHRSATARRSSPSAGAARAGRISSCRPPTTIPACSTASFRAARFPDVGFGTMPMITDARLLNHYFSVTGDDAVHRRAEARGGRLPRRWRRW